VSWRQIKCSNEYDPRFLTLLNLILDVKENKTTLKLFFLFKVSKIEKFRDFNFLTEIRTLKDFFSSRSFFCLRCPFIHSFIHAFIHSLVHSLVHSFIHSLVHSSVHSSRSMLGTFLRQIFLDRWFCRLGRFLKTCHQSYKTFYRRHLFIFVISWSVYPWQAFPLSSLSLASFSSLFLQTL
jgi:hypothetical protein